MRPGPGDSSRPILWLPAAALAVFALVRFDGWGWIADAWSSAGAEAYVERRNDKSFAGIPIERARDEIDRWVPAGEPIMLSPKIRADEDARQRFIEGLYPRRVEESAGPLVDAMSVAEAEQRHLTILATTKAGYAVTLQGGRDERRGVPGRDTTIQQGQLVRRKFDGLASFAIVIFVGLGFVGFAPRLRSLDLVRVLGVSILAGTVALGALASFATWFQIPVFRWGLYGLAFAALVMRAYLYYDGKGAPREPTDRPKVESLGFGIVLSLFCWVLLCTPIGGWDGRSIWLLRAKQIASEGMLSQADVTSKELAFSHPEYPLGFPAVMATLGDSYFRGFGERAAAIAIPMLTAAIFALLWQRSRAALGRWPGAAFTLAVFLSVAGLVKDGYADGYVVGCLAIGFLSLGSKEHVSLGWLALGCAALLKQEGLPFAALVVLAHVVRGTGAWKTGGKLWPALLFAPVAGHWIWRTFQGLKGDFAGPVTDVWDRVSTAVRVGASVAWNYPLVVEGTVAILGFAILWMAREGDPRRSGALRAAALAVAFVVLIVGIVSMTSRPVEWLAHTSMDRLLLHPAALALLAPFLLLRSAAGGSDPPPAPVSAEGSNDPSPPSPP